LARSVSPEDPGLMFVRLIRSGPSAPMEAEAGSDGRPRPNLARGAFYTRTRTANGLRSHHKRALLLEINTCGLRLGAGPMSLARVYLAIGATSIVVFVAITALVFSNATQAGDAQLALAINHFDLGGALTSAMVFLAEYGREYFWIPVVGVMLLLGGRETKLLALELAALFVVGIAAGEAMKFAVFRARPFETVATIITRVPTDTDSSYPSGHALIVTIGAAFSVVKFRKKAVGILLVLEAALVCYARVYVGMHYPLDVLSGIFLGIGIVGFGLFVLERYLGSTLSSLASFMNRVLRDGPLDL
jgi:membrane-associated phospholipid phosphatase